MDICGTPEKKLQRKYIRGSERPCDETTTSNPPVLEMLGPNGHIHTFHKEIVSRPVETTCCVEQLRGHR
ncbi:hypothetical protein TNCV_2668441 [Trichonephila clavipes]|nr:hypothetical protein TNCV_2668441 [Trichonephila clavipes]